MPLVTHISSQKLNIAVWEINETFEELCQLITKLKDDSFNKVKCEKICLQKKAARVALDHLIDTPKELEKDENGKPFLIGEHLKISLSLP